MSVDERHDFHEGEVQRPSANQEKKPPADAPTAEIAWQKDRHDEEYGHATQVLTNENYKVIKPFRQGVAQVCNVRIWKKLKRHIGKKVGTESPLLNEQKVGVTRGETQRLDHGVMSTAVLFTLLSDFRWRLQNLDPLPMRRLRAVRGFQFAVYSMKHGSLPENFPCKGIIKQEVVVLLLQLAASEGFRTVRAQRRREKSSLSGEDWIELWDEIADRTAAVLKITLEDLKKRLDIGDDNDCGKRLQGLRSRWGTVVAQCRKAIPYDWTEWLDCE
jgi:hypothetical protein